MSIINRTFIFILLGTRPLLGSARCRYVITCTPYAVQQLKQKNIGIAIWRIIKRVISCNPFW